MTLQPGDRIKLAHWPRFMTVTSVKEGGVWLDDPLWGPLRYKLSRKWIKEPWTPHDGGEAPTQNGVAVRRRDGREIDMPVGCAVDWKHTGAGSDILEWRALA